jgi:hypothetical protein
VNRVPNLQSAFDSQAAKRRDVLQRSASGRAIDVPGIANAVLRRNRLKRGFGVVKDDAGGMGGLTLAHAVLLEQGYVDAGCGKDVRRGATNRASPDNGDIGLERPAELWIGGSPGRRKRVGPKHGPVARFGQDRTILIHVFQIGLAGHSVKDATAGRDCPQARRPRRSRSRRARLRGMPHR